jgi:GH24 family phage-related lysozyme (muramidase)
MSIRSSSSPCQRPQRRPGGALRHWRRGQLPLALLAVGLSTPVAAQEQAGALAGGISQACRTMGPGVVYAVCLIVLVGTLGSLVQIRRALKAEGWSLANALSEPTQLTIPVDSRWSQSQGDKASDPTSAKPDSQSDQPVRITVLEASSSRFIAMVGMAAILLIYLGFGVFSLYTYGLTCQMPASTAAVTSFLYAGLTLFAPYVANKVSGLLKPQLNPSPARHPQAGPEALAYEPRPAQPEQPRRAAPEQAATLPVDHAREAPAPAAADHPQPAAATRLVINPPPHRVQTLTAPAAAPARPEPAAAAVAPASKAAPGPDRYAPAVSLIAEFEGFVDHAYPDPASGGEPWTIGYGFTTNRDGRPVQPGETISRAAADSQLQQGVQDCATHLAGTIPFWAEMAADQQCALISFAWNLGTDFYGSAGFDTISRDLRDKAWRQVPDGLLLYCDPGTSVEAGLRRRRQAEGDLWNKGLAAASATTSTAAPSAPSSPSAGKAAAGHGSHPNPLTVPWFDQLLMNDGAGWRDCFSASSAMLAAFWGKEPNEDSYNHLRQCYGDTTSAEAQLAALRHLGLQAEFHTDGALDNLRAEIDAGRPVAVGWLHHGPPEAPSGGGHWTVVIGYDETGFWMNDPYGSCDLVHGGYPSNHDGAHQHYSYKNWAPRWMPQGSAGWYLTCRP